MCSSSSSMEEEEWLMSRRPLLLLRVRGERVGVGVLEREEQVV